MVGLAAGLEVDRSSTASMVLRDSLAGTWRRTRFLAVRPIFCFLNVDTTRAFCPFNGLHRPLTSVQGNSLFGDCCFRAFGFGEFVGHISFVFVNGWGGGRRPFSGLSRDNRMGFLVAWCMLVITAWCGSL